MVVVRQHYAVLRALLRRRRRRRLRMCYALMLLAAFTIPMCHYDDAMTYCYELAVTMWHVQYQCTSSQHPHSEHVPAMTCDPCSPVTAKNIIAEPEHASWQQHSRTSHSVTVSTQGSSHTVVRAASPPSQCMVSTVALVVPLAGTT